MLKIHVKEGENIERALKRLKRKFSSTKTLQELRERKTFSKPSVVKRAQRQKATYVQSLRDQENF